VKARIYADLQSFVKALVIGIAKRELDRACDLPSAAIESWVLSAT
jgi:hypothetical protein